MGDLVVFEVGFYVRQGEWSYSSLEIMGLAEDFGAAF